MSKRCAMGSDAYVLRLAKVREEEQARAERVRKAEQAVIRAARKALTMMQRHGRISEYEVVLARPLARLDALTRRPHPEEAMTTETKPRTLEERLAESATARTTGHPATCECKGTGLIPVSGFTSPCTRVTIELPPSPEIAALRERAERAEAEVGKIAAEWGLPPTLLPKEGEVRRIRALAKDHAECARYGERVRREINEARASLAQARQDVVKWAQRAHVAEAEVDLARVTEEVALREKVIEDLNAGCLELEREVERLRSEGTFAAGVEAAAALVVAEVVGPITLRAEWASRLRALLPAPSPVGPDARRVLEQFLGPDNVRRDGPIPYAPSPVGSACEACGGDGMQAHPGCSGCLACDGPCPACHGSGRSTTKEK